MSANPTQFTGSNAENTSLFYRYGGAGQYNKSISITQDTYLTGSLYGASAIIVASGVSGSLEFPFGGTMQIADLTAGRVYTIGACRINPGGGTVYALYPGTRGSI